MVRNKATHERQGRQDNRVGPMAEQRRDIEIKYGCIIIEAPLLGRRRMVGVTEGERTWSVGENYLAEPRRDGG